MILITNFSDIELPKATNTSALSGAGVMRLFNKVGETVNKITYKMDESDPVCKKGIELFFQLLKYCRLFKKISPLVVRRETNTR